jgi:hypothetical protein
VSVTFALSASGLLHVAKAEVALEMQVGGDAGHVKTASNAPSDPRQRAPPPQPRQINPISTSPQLIPDRSFPPPHPISTSAGPPEKYDDYAEVFTPPRPPLFPRPTPFPPRYTGEVRRLRGGSDD